MMIGTYNAFTFLQSKSIVSFLENRTLQTCCLQAVERREGEKIAFDYLRGLLIVSNVQTSFFSYIY